MESKDGKKEIKLLRLMRDGFIGTSYAYAKKVSCNPAYAYRVLEGAVKRGACDKLVIEGKYMYKAVMK